MKLLKMTATALTAGAIAFGALAAAAADYPSKTVKAIVPFGAGGGTDRWARIMSSVAFDVMDHGWHIQNRGGAAGTIGWKFMLDQGADGHTILLASQTPRRRDRMTNHRSSPPPAILWLSISGGTRYP